MEEVDEIIEEMSELQKYIVLLLDSNSNAPIKGDSWFQKELFLIVKNIAQLEEESSFASDMYGPWSENADEQLEELEMDEVVSRLNKKMLLSQLGRDVAENLKVEVPEKDLEMIFDFKDLLNNLSSDELLTFIYFSFPEYTEESLVIGKIRENRVKNAIGLFNKGKISLQKASDIAGIPLEKFVKVV
ncbi:MAG: hypothetical protein PWQ51_1814 [Methanolobus sp.]|jgi:uncharacterized protein YwgA|nr:hypothetical protein [Methanolobus sp.]